jgi:ABC-2 type transport system permease protein
MTTKPFYWSVKREVWENRAVLVVPASAAILFLVAFSLNLPGLSSALPDILQLDPEAQTARLMRPYRIACFLVTMASLLTGLFYSLDALHGERRDRSILFWKSLPVSDRVTVLSKAFIPLVLLPAVTLAFTLGTHLVMVVLGAGVMPFSTLKELPLLSLWGETAAGVAVLALWQAPIQAWLLLVSGWARRAVLLWAVLLPLAVCLFEKFAFGSNHLIVLIVNRLTAGVLGEGVIAGHWLGLSPLERLTKLSPAALAADPNLWLGLIPTALLLGGAIASRRYRQPI